MAFPMPCSVSRDSCTVCRDTTIHTKHRQHVVDPSVACVLYLLGCLKVLFNQVLHPQPLHRSAFHHFAVIHVAVILV